MHNNIRKNKYQISEMKHWPKMKSFRSQVSIVNESNKTMQFNSSSYLPLKIETISLYSAKSYKVKIKTQVPQWSLLLSIFLPLNPHIQHTKSLASLYSSASVPLHRTLSKLYQILPCFYQNTVSEFARKKLKENCSIHVPAHTYIYIRTHTNCVQH